MRFFRIGHSIVFGLALATAVQSALGQATNSGDIRGVVTDATGAVVADVTVTVVNISTGITKVLTTNRDGLYDTSSIVVGTYKLTFEKTGFSQLERSSISLEVGVSTVNAQMKVGSTTENVVVNTDIPLLETESGTQQTTLEARTMAALPNVGQDWQNFTILIPGTSGTPGGSQGQVNPGQTMSANGNLPYSNVLADGSSTTLSHSQNSDVNVFETVAELQVSTSAFSAQYGIGGIIFNQISKGGGSRFHGAAYDYNQNSEFSSLGANFSGTPNTLAPLHYNNFGGSISGPVAVPILSLNHKAFFYFNYDQIVNHGAAGNHVRDIPTTAVMSGDFTGQSLLYDPTTQTIGHDVKGNPYPIRKSFMSEYGTNAIPVGLQDKLAQNFQKLYPTPSNHTPYGSFIPGTVNTRGVLQGNFKSSVPSSSPFRKYFGRFDFDINSKNRLTVSIQQRDTPDVFPSDFVPCPVACQNGDVDSYNPQVTDVWTINSHLINEARFGYTYQGNFYADQALGKGYAAQLGWQFAKADDFPNITFEGNYPYSWIQPSSNAVYKEHVFDPSDVLTMIRGKHVLHFGGEFALYRDDSTAWGNTNAGHLKFTGQYTQNWIPNPDPSKPGTFTPDGSTGADYADFLLGQANEWDAGVSPEYGARLKNPQVFVQDDYKLRPNLTLNLGVRYQIRHGWTEVHGNMATYDPTVVNPANGTLGAEWFGTTHANGRTQLESNKWNTVLPRVGFAWLPSPNMTVRGGFGLYAYNLSLDTYGGGMGAAISSSGNASDQSGGITPVTILGGTGTLFNNGAPLPYSTASTSPDRFNGQDVGYTQYDTPNPEIYQYNFGVQQALGSNMVFDIAYVGSHANHLNFGTDLNQVPTAYLAQGPNNLQYRPNQNFHAINGSTNDGISNYNSLQVQLNRRLSRGLSFGLNYTWAHFLDSQDSSGWGSHSGPTPRQYPDAPSNYSNSNFDVRNAFKGLVAYELPFGHGRQFLNNNWLADEVLGGFQVSSTMQFTSGNPFSVFSFLSNDYSESGTTRPFASYAAGGQLAGVPGGRNAYEWFNPANFTAPANGTFGNVRRNSLYGPGLELVNLSASKRIDIRESVKLQLRLDANNAFNHTSLGQPNGNLITTLGSSGGFGGNGISLNSGVKNGQITSAKVSGRNLQAGVRLEF